MDTSPKGQVRLSLILFAASVAIAAFFSIPSWLPVFGIELEWFGNALVVMTQRFLPLTAVILGFIVGWIARGKQAKAKAKAEYDMKKLARDEAARDIQQNQIRQLRNLGSRSKDCLWKVWQEGEITGSIHDSAISQLQKMGVISVPPRFNPLEATFAIDPRANQLISENADTIFYENEYQKDTE